MKRLFSVALIAALMPCLCGCDSGYDVANISVVRVLGVDRCENGYEIAALVDTLDEQTRYAVISAFGETPEQALSALLGESSLDLFFKRCEYIAFSDGLTIEDFTECCSYFLDCSLIKENINTVFCKGKAMEYIGGIIGFSMPETAASVFELERNSGYKTPLFTVLSYRPLHVRIDYFPYLKIDGDAIECEMKKIFDLGDG